MLLTRNAVEIRSLKYNNGVITIDGQRELSLLAISKTNFELINFDLLETQKGNTLTENDVVYFCKTSITPRVKIKEYYDKNNMVLNKTNRIQYANTFVLNYDDLKLLKEIGHGSNNSQHQFRNYLLLNTKVFLDKNDGIYSGYHQTKNPIRAEIMAVDEGIYMYGGRNPGSLHQELKGKYFGTESYFFIKDKLSSLFEIIDVYLSNPKIYKIVYDQSISKLISEFELKLSPFIQLNGMLKSKSDEDKIMACGILSSCDRELYKIPILLLMNKYYEHIKKFKDLDVNVKMLFEYFKSYELGTECIEFVNKLIKTEKTIDEETKSILNHYLLNEVQSIFSGIKDLQIESIEIKLNK